MFSCIPWPFQTDATIRSIERQNRDVLCSEVSKKTFKKNEKIMMDGSKYMFCYIYCDSLGRMSNTEDEFPLLNREPNCIVISVKNDQTHSGRASFTIYARRVSNYGIHKLIATEMEMNEKVIDNWSRFVENKVRTIRNVHGIWEALYWYRAYSKTLGVEGISWYQILSNTI